MAKGHSKLIRSRATVNLVARCHNRLGRWTDSACKSAPSFAPCKLIVRIVTAHLHLSWTASREPASYLVDTIAKKIENL